jgi:succinylglutamate desuccinylase
VRIGWHFAGSCEFVRIGWHVADRIVARMSSPAAVARETGLPVPVAAVPAARQLGRRVDRPAGPRLVCVAGLHGNEPAGVAALERVFAALANVAEPLAGGIAGFAGHLGALAAGRRYLDRDLNRMWREPTLAAVRSGERHTREDHELAALDAALAAELASAAPRRAFLLDLHTTSGAGPPFAILDDSLPNRRFALAFPVPLVLGLEEELVGTLVFGLSARGVTSLAFEGGRHDDPAAVDRCEAAVWIALDAAGVLPRALRSRAEAGRRLLRASRGTTPQLVEVLYRHRIAEDDRFRMQPGFASFDRVERGQPLASDRAGTVAAPMGGRLLMPLYQPLGDDGFFLARPVARFWFELSATLRRLRADRLLRWLPGVTPHASVADAYLVHRRVARFFVRDLFHLLGYRRLDAGPAHFVFTRRPEGL